MVDLPDSLEYRLSDDGLVFACDMKAFKSFAIVGDKLVEIEDPRTSAKVRARMLRLSKAEAEELLKAAK